MTNGWDKFFLMHYQNDDEEIAEAARRGKKFLGKRKNIMTVGVVKGGGGGEDEDSEPSEVEARSRSGIFYFTFFF